MKLTLTALLLLTTIPGYCKTIEIAFEPTTPLNITSTQLLCSSLYSHLSSEAIYHLDATQGIPYTCAWSSGQSTNSDGDTTYGTLTMTLYTID